MGKPHFLKLVPVIGGPLDGGHVEHRRGTINGVESCFNDTPVIDGVHFPRHYVYRYDEDLRRYVYVRTGEGHAPRGGRYR